MISLDILNHFYVDKKKKRPIYEVRITPVGSIVKVGDVFTDDIGNRFRIKSFELVCRMPNESGVCDDKEHSFFITLDNQINGCKLLRKDIEDV